MILWSFYSFFLYFFFFFLSLWWPLFFSYQHFSDTCIWYEYYSFSGSDGYHSLNAQSDRRKRHLTLQHIFPPSIILPGHLNNTAAHCLVRRANRSRIQEWSILTYDRKLFGSDAGCRFFFFFLGWKAKWSPGLISRFQFQRSAVLFLRYASVNRFHCRYRCAYLDVDIHSFFLLSITGAHKFGVPGPLHLFPLAGAHWYVF